MAALVETMYSTREKGHAKEIITMDIYGDNKKMTSENIFRQADYDKR